MMQSVTLDSFSFVLVAAISLVSMGASFLLVIRAYESVIGILEALVGKADQPHSRNRR
jgi:hypothetical protein